MVEERVLIVPDKDSETAQYFIEYHLNIHQSGEQIPFLFYASEYKEGFKIWLDGNEISLSTVDQKQEELKNTPFENFDYYFDDKYWSDSKNFHIEKENDQITSLDFTEFLLFETDLSKGKHIVKIQLTGDKWEEFHDWVNPYSFRYETAPSNYWKEYGKLSLNVDCSNCPEMPTSNWGPSSIDSFSSKFSWSFDAPPSNGLTLYFEPSIPPKANFLIKLSPYGIAMLLSLPLMLIHFFILRKYRIKFSHKKITLPLIIGALLIPAFYIYFYFESHFFIDNLIGSNAKRFHGFLASIIIWYPIMVLLYSLLFWFLSKRYKQ